MFTACVLVFLTTVGHARVTAAEPWVEAARAKLSSIFPDFMDAEVRAIDEGLLLEVQRLDALIPGEIARQNFRNLLTKIWVIPSRAHLSLYRARLGSSPAVAYPYYHGIELVPQVALGGAAGRTFLIEALTHGFDRVTGFGRRHVPGVSWTGVLETRARRAEVAFLARYTTPEDRGRWRDEVIARRDRGFRDMYLKFYHRLAAADGADPAPIFDEVLREPYRARVECEMGLWRRYDPVRDRGRLLTARPSAD